jgi:hypothetical protein
MRRVEHGRCRFDSKRYHAPWARWRAMYWASSPRQLGRRAEHVIGRMPALDASEPFLPFIP